MKNKFFEEIKGNFGFGFMRLPKIEDEVDYEETCKMVDAFMESGFNYFDTAHNYIKGKSEIALRECLVKRYPRESFLIVDKLTPSYFNSEEEIRPLVQEQLDAVGVEYFDFFLMHAQDAEYFEKYKKCRAYETAFELKKEGKLRHVGFSFHDTPEVLDQILTEYPEFEVVQIQLNYLDYDSPSVQAKKCYEVCVKHNKPVIIMEPVKGGHLVNFTPEAQQVFDELQGGSNASYAIRFAAGFDNVMMVLSGMSNMEQMEDNLSFMKDFKPLNEKEMEAVWKVCDIIKKQNSIPCTGCRYCVDGCPMKIAIPEVFADLNNKKVYQSWDAGDHYKEHTAEGGKASACIKCGKCEKICPQHLEIRKLLEEVAEVFEKKEA